MKNINIIAFISLLLFSCNPVPEVVNDNYVVEAYVFSKEPIREVTVKTLVPLSDPEGESASIETAIVTIKKNANSYSLTYNSRSRKYEYLGADLEILPKEVIDLEVEVNGRVSKATTIVPTPPVNIQSTKDQMVIPVINSGLDFLNGDPLADAEIIVNWSNPNNELHYSVIEFRSNLLKPILPPDVQQVVDGILEDFAIITVPSTDTTLTVSGALLPSYGPYMVKIYKVNQEYADLYDSEEQDSRDLNEPPSNIINARGIFSAFASDSVAFEVN
jgi:uncharacterized protein DUF4249